MKIVKAGGTVVTATVAGNSDKVLYLTADLGFDPTGCQYLIVEPVVGGVWKFDGTNWVKPTGTDVQRMGVETAADCLLIKIGNGEILDFAADNSVIEIHVPGQLSFIANDEFQPDFSGHNGYKDNSGSLQVTVEVTRP